eukprot:CAMPEP_0201481078 /NCGR_PEP_ID=MMETSP0151_2-20130828/5406_1 /ASSEMBLY_ACC=CAM_ASM_000257 /TAXON_ID=200890 /ORGANISM="Paramoeba atlantica, Strain 621/1 / CCAP 1560/9" /LENGTH=213 /DNA_ID=CAMNT_0047863111 /DNA_START=82 /DNA_END=720 /DNA_ORIENTATION=-
MFRIHHISVCFLFVVVCFGYQQSEKERAIQETLEGYGGTVPRLAIFDHPHLTPAALFKLEPFFLKLLEGVDYFEAPEMFIIFAATSAQNGCEICQCFLQSSVSQSLGEDDAKEITRGGLPSDKRGRLLVTATKMLNAHGGILLPRERQHLNMLGLSDEEIFEINMLSGAMSMFNRMYIHLLSTENVVEGCLIDSFLAPSSPFAETVFGNPKDE